jgi:hypothetical protein
MQRDDSREIGLTEPPSLERNGRARLAVSAKKHPSYGRRLCAHRITSA